MLVVCGCMFRVDLYGALLFGWFDCAFVFGSVFIGWTSRLLVLSAY